MKWSFQTTICPAKAGRDGGRPIEAAVRGGNRVRALSAALAAALILALSTVSAPALATEEPAAGEDEASGKPMSLFGGGSPDQSGDARDTTELPTVPGSEPGQAVRAGDLDDVGALAVGLLEGPAEGFDLSMWRASQAARVEADLPRLPLALTSPLRQALFTNLLLAPASPPAGLSSADFVGLRAEVLLDRGFVEEAEGLLALLPDLTLEGRALQVTTRLNLLNAEDRKACAAAARMRHVEEGHFWPRLRIFCYILAGDLSTADLNVALLTEEGLITEEFSALVAWAEGRGGDLPPQSAVTDEVSLALWRLGAGDKGEGEAALQSEALPLPLSWPLRNRLRQSGEPNIREALAREALARGWASTEALAALWRAQEISETDRTALLAELQGFAAPEPDQAGQAGQADQAGQAGQPGANRPAALLQAFDKAVMPVEKAKILSLAWAEAVRVSDRQVVASLYGPELKTIPPSPVLELYALDFAELALRAGRSGEAAAWLRLTGPAQLMTIVDRDRYVDLKILVGLAATQPGAAPSWDAAGRLTRLQGTPKERQALLEVAFHAALGGWLDDQTRALLIASGFEEEERLPSPEVLARMETASRTGRSGETVLYVLQALSDSKSAQIPMGVLEKAVRALARANFTNEAKTLAIESLLAPS